jgi:hypothetical protein
MNHGERFDAVMNFRPVDRLPRIEWAGYWDKTTTRWYEEGLDPEIKGAPAIRRHLGLDPYSQFWIVSRSGDTPRADHHLGSIIEDEAGYERILSTLFRLPDFQAPHFQSILPEVNAGERVVWMSFDGHFWGPRLLLGVQNHMMAFYDQPDLIHRMNRDLLDFNMRVLEGFCDGVCIPQFMTIAEDMSYNKGPMLSEAHFDEFLAPYYEPFCKALRERGIRVLVDSDGDVMPLIPWLKRVGVEGILPLERMAGVDVGQIREDHPEFLMIGAYNKLIMKDGEAAQRAEFERLLPTMQSGGFIPSVDHQTPPDVSLENYHHYLRLLTEYSQAK